MSNKNVNEPKKAPTPEVSVPAASPEVNSVPVIPNAPGAGEPTPIPPATPGGNP